jgi:hypothetical protein
MSVDILVSKVTRYGTDYFGSFPSRGRGFIFCCYVHIDSVTQQPTVTGGSISRRLERDYIKCLQIPLGYVFLHNRSL